MKVTLSNGLVIEGDQTQVVETVKKLGFNLRGYYNSESKGLVKITDMHTSHLRNAILKYYEDWVNGLHSISNPQVLVERLITGIDDEMWIDMVKEYNTRKEI